MVLIYFPNEQKNAKKINSQEWLMNHALKAMGIRTPKLFEK